MIIYKKKSNNILIVFSTHLKADGLKSALLSHLQDRLWFLGSIQALVEFFGAGRPISELFLFLHSQTRLYIHRAVKCHRVPQAAHFMLRDLAQPPRDHLFQRNIVLLCCLQSAVLTVCLCLCVINLCCLFFALYFLIKGSGI